MKVLITAPNLDDSKQVGGIITVINTILSVISVRHDVFVRSPDQARKHQLLGKAQWLGKVWGYLRVNLAGRYDIIHVHTALNKPAILRDFLWVFFGKFFKAKVLLHVHGGRYLFEKPKGGAMLRIVGRLFNLADAIIVLSEKERDALGWLYTIRKPVYVLENAINLIGVPEGGPVGNGAKDGLLRLIFIGRITESKGIADILEAIGSMDDGEKAKLRLDVYGDGDMKDALVNEAGKLLGNNFAYHGIVWGEDKWRAIQQADVFLLPSRYGEGLPMALLEAMAMGKVVLTTNDASMGLVVQNGVNGLMVEKYNPEDIKGTLRAIQALPVASRDQMGAEAARTVAENFSAGQYIQKLETIYREVSTQQNQARP